MPRHSRKKGEKPGWNVINTNDNGNEALADESFIDNHHDNSQDSNYEAGNAIIGNDAVPTQVNQVNITEFGEEGDADENEDNDELDNSHNQMDIDDSENDSNEGEISNARKSRISKKANNESINVKRAGFTNHQKRALRDWVQAQETKPNQRQCIDWFFTKFGRRISQSGVSRCLSKKSKHLDDEAVNETSIRNRYGKYPVLEDMLVDWQLYQSKTGGAVTAALLLKKAKELWYRIPEYRGIEPEFNYRWLDRFRKRHNIEYSRGTNGGRLSNSPGIQRIGSTSLSGDRGNSILEELAEASSNINSNSLRSRPELPLSSDPAIANTDPALFDNNTNNSATNGNADADSGANINDITTENTGLPESIDDAHFTTSGSVNDNLRALQLLCSTYDPSNIYTVMETGFHWRKSLSTANSIQTLLPRHPLASYNGTKRTDRSGDNVSISATNNHEDVSAAAAAAVALVAANAASDANNPSHTSDPTTSNTGSATIQDDDINPELAAIQNAAAAAVAVATGTADVTAQDVARSVLAQQNQKQTNNMLAAVNATISGNLSNHLNADAKAEKFTVLISSNCSGTDRIPIHFIAYEKPRSLLNVNLPAINAAWITRRIPGLDVFTMRKWLSEFVSHIRSKAGSRSKKYLLILYRNPVHEDAVKLVYFPPNIRVEFLNERGHESGGLPLEQEVVQRWKLNYSYHWLKYILGSYNGELLEQDKGHDPLETVEVFQSIQWAVQSWYHEISDAVFRNAFLSSAICRSVNPLEPVENLPNIDLVYQAIKHTGRVPDIVDIDEFLNSDFDVPDIVDDSEGDLLDAIVERRLGQGDNHSSTGATFTSLIDDNTGLDDVPNDILTIDQASHYMNEIIRWCVHQRSLSKSEIFPLLGLQSFINRRRSDEVRRTEDATVAAAAAAAAAAVAAAATDESNIS